MSLGDIGGGYGLGTSDLMRIAAGNKALQKQTDAKRDAFVANNPDYIAQYEGDPRSVGVQHGSDSSGFLGIGATSSTTQAPVVKQNFEYLGRPGGAESEYVHQQALAQAARMQQAPDISGYTQRNSGIYGQQQNLASQLQQQAAGQGPSLAQAQLMAGRDASIQQAMALANSARGGAGQRAASGYGAMQQAAAAAQQNAQQSAMLRMQEQLQARQQLAGIYGQMGQQNQNMAGLVGNLQLSQGQLNSQNAQQYNQNAINVALQQRQAMANYEGLMSGNFNAAQGYANAQTMQANQQASNLTNSVIGGALGLGAAVMPALAPAAAATEVAIHH